MRTKATPQSGLSSQFQYGQFLPLDKVARLLRDYAVYLIKDYGTDGFCVSISRTYEKTDIDISVIFSDWNGEPIALDGKEPIAVLARYYLKTHSIKMLEVMKAIGIATAKAYLVPGVNDIMLVDVFHKDGLIGPGMLRDVFGRILPTQEVVKVGRMDDNTAALINVGHGLFGDGTIIKPSKFKAIIGDDGITRPLYGRHLVSNRA